MGDLLCPAQSLTVATAGRFFLLLLIAVVTYPQTVAVFIALTAWLSDDLPHGSPVRPVHALGARRRANIMITAMLCLFCFMSGGTIGFTVAAVLANRRKADERRATVSGFERGPKYGSSELN
jgi:hypothetical protein